MNRTRTAFAAAIAAIAVTGLSVGAARAQQQSVSVSSAGLDLNTQAGAKTFYRRLSQAAIALCGGAPTSFFSTEEERYQACYRQTVTAAALQSHAPLVAALADKTAHRSQLASR